MAKQRTPPGSDNASTGDDARALHDTLAFRAAVRDVKPLAQTPEPKGLAKTRPRTRVRMSAPAGNSLGEMMPLLPVPPIIAGDGAPTAPQAAGAIADALAAFDQKVAVLAPTPQPNEGGRGGRGPSTGSGQAGSGGRGGRGGTPAAAPDSLVAASAALAGVMNLLQGADVRPTTVQLDAIANARATASKAMSKWTAIKTVDLPALNAKLKAGGLLAINP